MAARILAGGFDLSVWARRPAGLDPFVLLGARPASDPSTLAAGVDIVCLCVRADDDVEMVCAGAAGVLAGLRPGATLVIHSTVAPATVQGLAERAAAVGADLLDAPVSGGGAAAEAGRLLTMVGGNPLVLERCRAVLATHSDRIVLVGDVGSAQMSKLLNNGLFAAGVALAHSALAAGERLGLDRAALGEALGGGSGRSFALDTVAAAGGADLRVVARELLAKDVALLEALLGDGRDQLLIAARWVLGGGPEHPPD
jgi:3-hydroxyisobutyrate dehydrogenase-like beta-hydroxyacid dehydrogenase